MADHPKRCECRVCVARKVSEALDRIRDASAMVPKSVDATVAVRAHWRRQKNHLSKQPKLRDALHDALRRLMKEAK